MRDIASRDRYKSTWGNESNIEWPRICGVSGVKNDEGAIYWALVIFRFSVYPAVGPIVPVSIDCGRLYYIIY